MPRPAAVLAVPHVATQIHFVKVAMEGNRDTAHARIQKPETDQAYVRASLPKVDLDATRHMRREQRRIDFVIQHH